METKTQHMRRMRLRRKYWRASPTTAPVILTYRNNVMCVERNDHD